MLHRLKNIGGFTLIELVVAVAVIAILTGISTPFVSSIIATYQLKRSVREMAGTFQTTRAEAIKRGNNCVVTFRLSVGGTAYDYVAYVDSNKDFTLDAGEQVLRGVSLPSGGGGHDHDHEEHGGITIDYDSISFADNVDGKPSVGFTPLGVLKDSNPATTEGSVVIHNDQGKSLEVKITYGGSVKID